MQTIDEQARDLGTRWVQAEQSGDSATLDALSTDDFTLIGPLGFILDKQQWLDRYRDGNLVTRSLTWDDLSVRDYGSTAVVIGRHTQEAEFRGRRTDGEFRATHILVQRTGRWLLAGIQLSPIGALPPFAAAPAQAAPVHQEGDAR